MGGHISFPLGYTSHTTSSCTADIPEGSFSIPDKFPLFFLHVPYSILPRRPVATHDFDSASKLAKFAGSLRPARAFRLFLLFLFGAPPRLHAQQLHALGCSRPFCPHGLIPCP